MGIRLFWHLLAITAVVAVAYATRARIQVRLWHMFVITAIIAVALVNRHELHYRATRLYFVVWPNPASSPEAVLDSMLQTYQFETEIWEEHKDNPPFPGFHPYEGTNELLNGYFKEVPDNWLPAELRQFRTQEWKKRREDLNMRLRKQRTAQFSSWYGSQAD